MKPVVAVIAMVNGMIGGLILVLPLLAAEGGSILSGLIILVTGFFSFYSCYLCLIHLGDFEDLDKALVYHFNGSRIVKIFYDFLVFINLVFLLLLYFNLIVQQWEGLLPYNIANPICNAFALVFLTIGLNYFHFGAELLGYGIISIIGYCIFLVWLIVTAPSGENSVPLFGKGAVNLAASMGQAFAIQTFFIPVLKELPSSKNFVRYTFIAYSIGTSVYLYIAYTGSFGIINRSIIINPVQTVEDYFHPDTWEVAVVEVIYLIHLYSAFGEFLLVAKKRFFGIFNLPESGPRKILNIPELILVVLVIAACAGIFFGNVTIENLIEINGAIIGFFFIYLLPALMHAKCIYLPCCKLPEPEANIYNNTTAVRDQMIEMKGIDMPERKHTEQVDQIIIRRTSQVQSEKDSRADSQVKPYEQKAIGPCTVKRPKAWLMALDLISLVGMVGLGAFIMVDGFISVITGES